MENTENTPVIVEKKPNLGETNDSYYGIEDPVKESTDDFYETSKEGIPNSVAINRAGYASFAVPSPDPVNVFKTIKDEYTLIGESPTYSTISEQVREDARFELSGVIDDTAKLGDIEAVKKLIQASPVILEERGTVRASALNNLSEAQVMKDNTIRGKDYQAWYLSNFEDRLKSKEGINRVFDESVSHGSLDLMDNALDMAGTLVVSEQLFLSRAAKKILGESYFALGGSMKKDMADWILQGKGSKDKVERAKQVAEAITEAAGYKGTNDVVKTYAIESVRDYINNPTDDFDWHKLIDNVVGVVGVVPLISEQVIASTLKSLPGIAKASIAARRGGKLLNEVGEANPDVASAMLREALKSTETAESLGMTKGDVVQQALPHGALETTIHLEGAPQQLLDDILGTQTIANEIEASVENTFMFSDESYKNAQKIIMEILNDSEVTGIAVPSVSSMKRVGNKIEVNAVYGDNHKYPISSIERAQELKSLLESQFRLNRGVKIGAPIEYQPKVKIVVKDDVTGAFVEEGKATVKTVPRYFVTVEESMPMLFSDIVPDSFLTKSVSKFGKWIRMPEEYISKLVKGMGVVAHEKRSFIEHELKSIAKPFLNLGHSSKVRVSELLKSGEDFVDPVTQVRGKVFNYSELEGSYSAEEIKAYYSTRAFNDTVYRLKNSQLYDKLNKDGVKSINISFGEKSFQNAGRPLDAKEASSVKIAWDPISEESIDLTESMIASIYENGQKLVKLKSRIDIGPKEFSYAIVKDSDISDLPKNVLPYNIGYNLRVNTDPYFIEQINTKIVDGVLTKGVVKTIGVAKNSYQASKWVKDLSASVKGPEFKFRLDRNISPSDSTLKTDYDVLDGSAPGLWYSRRGARLTRQDGSLSAVQDPVESIHQLSRSVADSATHREMFEAAIERHKKTYGNITVQGRSLWNYSPEMKKYVYVGKEFSESVHPEIKAANREYEYLEALQEMPTGVDLIWKDLMLSIDRAVSKNSLASQVSKKVLLEGLADLGPSKILRNTTFALTIPLRPAKQLPLQWSTGLHLSGIDPIATARSFKDSPLMMYSFAMYNDPKKWDRYVVPVAKAFGHDPDEWKEIFNQFRRTGKAYSIDSDAMVNEANFGWSRSMPETALGRVGRATAGVLKSPFTIGKRLGFDLGEFGNQATTWLFARQYWIKKNPGKVWNSSQSNLDEIARLSRNFSIDMTKTNTLPYQKGGFAVITQFMAINHKMAGKILGADPDIARSKNLQEALRADHTRYLIGMAVMYGASGFGLQDYYEEMRLKEGFIIPPELDDAFYGGLSQYLFNSSLALAFSEEYGTSSIRSSDTFSPAAGIINAPIELAKAIFDAESLQDALMGPSRSTFPRIGRAADHVATVWGRKDFETEEKLLEAAHAIISEFGMFSDAFNYSLAMSYKEKMDTYNVINRKGLVGVPSTHAELFAKMMFNLQTKNESEFYGVIQKLNKETYDGTNNKEVSRDAERLAEWWWRQYLSSNGDMEVFENNVRPVMNGLNNGGDRLRNNQVLKEARKIIRQRPDFNKYITNIIEKTKILDPNADMEMLRNVANSTSIIKEEDRALNNRFLDEMELNVENARRILEEEGDY